MYMFYNLNCFILVVIFNGDKMPVFHTAGLFYTRPSRPLSVKPPGVFELNLVHKTITFSVSLILGSELHLLSWLRLPEPGA